MPALRKRSVRPSLSDSLVAGLAFAGAGGACAALSVAGAVGEGWRTLVPIAAASAFVVGGAAWWQLPPRKRSPAIGAGVGALVGVVSHPVAWYGLELASWLAGERDSLGQPTLGPAAAVPASLTFSLLSLAFVGWLTVPAGALVGALLGRWLATASSPER